MNYLLRLVILMNAFLIPAQIIVTPFIMDSMWVCDYEGTWQTVCLDSKSGWTYIMILVPIVGTNFVLIIFGGLMGLGVSEPKLTTTKTPIKEDDRYANWTPEWREFQLKKDAIDKKNQEDSKDILKKYESLPDMRENQS